MWRDTAAQWIMAAFGVVATFVSIWAVVLLYKTLRATRGAVDESRRATRAAEAAVKVTSDTARRQLRAYLHITSAEITGTGSGASPNIIFTLKNSGLTPAYNVQHSKKIAVIKPRERDFDMSDARLFREPDIAPKQDISPRTVITAFKWIDIRRQLLKKDGTLYIFGRINYTDTFGNNWQTEYRFYLFIDDDGITDRDLNVAKDGNETT